MENSNLTRKLVLFGAGGIGRIALEHMEKSQKQVDFFVDNNPDLWGKEIKGVPVYSPKVLQHEKADILVTVGQSLYDDIRDQLSETGLRENEHFYNFIKLFKIGWDEFGMASGNVDFAPGLKAIKSLSPNRLCLDLNNRHVYRFMSPDFVEIYSRCERGGIFGKYIIPTKRSEHKLCPARCVCFEHAYIPLFSYAVEWSPNMFFDYTLFMIDFLADLDRIGLGWGDGHPFNATIHRGKFVFFDFDALLLGKTQCYRIQEFIDYHILILHLMAKNMEQKAYLYLNNADPEVSINIKDISGYLTQDELEHYNNMVQNYLKSAMKGDIQTCCIQMKEYVSGIRISRICESGWDGYQNELYEAADVTTWSDKQRAVIEMVRSVKPKTLLDLAGNMGWYEFMLCNEVERCIVADLDYSCVDFVYQTVVQRKVENVYPVYLNLVTPTPAYYKDTPIGDTAIIPWRKSAIDRFKSEMVLALAIVHHLAFSQQLSFEEIIGQFALYTSKWLIIEFMEREDSVVAPALKNPNFDWYTQEGFERVLKTQFRILSSIHSEPTRILYLCAKIG